jgi:hypothetical protein
MRLIALLFLIAGLPACGGDGPIDQTCDEPQRYQRIVASKRIEPPEGLDPLNEFAEMPIPEPQNAPVRPPGSRCIELPPSVDSGQ